ncbi:hypothetical protein Hanom_Chr00s002600g01701881 [Helianthus anomalus]
MLLFCLLFQVLLPFSMSSTLFGTHTRSCTQSACFLDDVWIYSRPICVVDNYQSRIAFILKFSERDSSSHKNMAKRLARNGSLSD